jgi:hypothetical protein
MRSAALYVSGAIAALGVSFLDAGVGGFLKVQENPDRQWMPMAKSFIGKYRQPPCETSISGRARISSRHTCTTAT